MQTRTQPLFPKVKVLWQNIFEIIIVYKIVELLFHIIYNRGIKYGGVVELADTRDLKSLGGDTVRVRVSLPPPMGNNS